MDGSELIPWLEALSEEVLGCENIRDQVSCAQGIADKVEELGSPDKAEAIRSSALGWLEQVEGLSYNPEGANP